MSRITLKFFSVTPQTLLTTENLCFKQKSNFYEKVLPPTGTIGWSLTTWLLLLGTCWMMWLTPDGFALAPKIDV